MDLLRRAGTARRLVGGGATVGACLTPVRDRPVGKTLQRVEKLAGAVLLGQAASRTSR